jgi:hypothetical protein
LFAQLFSTSFSLRINGLHDFDKTMTAPFAVSACIGAPVEFPGRAVAGFPDD